MTRKATLCAWAESLGAISADDADKMTAAQLEQAIETAIAKPTPTGMTFRDGLAANWRVIRDELPNVGRAVAQNLFS